MNFDSYSNNFEVTSQYNFDVGPSSTGSNFDDKEPFSNSSLNSGESLYFDWFTSSNSSNSNISDGSSLNNFNNDQHFMPKFFVMSTTSNFQNPSSSSSFDINYHQQQHQQQQRFIDSNNNNNMMEIEQLKAPETLFNLDEINQDQDDEDPTIEVAELDDDGDNSDDEFTGYYNNNNNNNNNMGNLPASKTPCLDATAYCAELNLGAERDPFSSDIIKITNFNIFIENLKKICPKQNQTQNDEARIKALRRWFDGIPNKKKRRESFSIKMKGDKKNKILNCFRRVQRFFK